MRGHVGSSTGISNSVMTSNQPTLRVSSNTQATLEQSSIQVLTELNVASLQGSYENWYDTSIFKLINPKKHFAA